MYRYTETGEILRESDGACIPCDASNRDYRKLVAEAVEIAPYVPEISPFEGEELAIHDEWVIEQAARRALSRIQLDVATDQARNARPDPFSNTDSPQTVSDPMGEALERQREANKQLCAPAIPDEIAALLEDGETLTKDVRRKLTERLNVELAELKNLRGLAGEDLKREAEIEKLLGLFARLGEI